MKVLLLTLFVSFGCTQKIQPHLVTSWTNLIAPFIEECIAESKADPTQAKNIFQTLPVDVTKNFECYFKCLFQKINFTLSNGEFDQKMVYQIIPDIEEPLLKQCIDDHIQDSDICHRSYSVAICIMKMGT
ncbi:hypothetical protein FQA39_LY12373 [Lamprigera yunnana]|nr:hypothetical protein FQA39_LY12373 [Lamprigera yunnana]